MLHSLLNGLAKRIHHLLFALFELLGRHPGKVHVVLVLVDLEDEFKHPAKVIELSDTIGRRV